MEKKSRKRRRWPWVVAGVVLVLAVCAVLLGVFALPKKVQVDNPYPQLGSMANGTYTGQYDNGIVGAKVEVDIQDGVITDIRIIEHRQGMGKPGEAVVQAVQESQNLDVDAVAGATFSSLTILKAIENALQP